MAAAKRSVTSTIPSMKAKLRTRDSSAWSACTRVNVNCANSDTEPGHVAEDHDVGTVGVALAPGRVEGHAARLEGSPGGGAGVQPAGRLLAAPAADAGGELPGQRPDRPPQLVELDR